MASSAASSSSSYSSSSSQALREWFSQVLEEKSVDANDLNYEMFGNYTPNQAEDLGNELFPESAIERGKLQNVWEELKRSKSASPVLQVDLSSGTDPLIIEALIATNKLLRDRPLDQLLLGKMDALEVSKNMSKLKIKWCTDPLCQDCEQGALGFTERKKKTHSIYLNSHLKRLCEGGGEQTATRTKFIIAVTIYHEIGHLLLRWQNIMHTPTNFQGRNNSEAGEYSELRALGGVVQLDVKINPSSGSRKRPRNASQATLKTTKTIEGVLLRFPASTIIKTVDDGFIKNMLDPKNEMPFELGLKVNCKSWIRLKNHRCLKSGPDEEVVREIGQSYVLSPGHYLYEPPSKRR